MGEPMGPKGQPMVQSSTVNVSTSREMPKDYFVWSLISVLNLNPCCLGLAALIHSVKARDRKVVGDVEGARSYGGTARTLNIIATVLGCLIGLIVFIVVIVQLQQFARLIQSISEKGRSNYG